MKTYDPGLPGMYEVHLLYRFGKRSPVQYQVVLLVAPTFARALELASIQVQANAGYQTRPFEITDNLINLITDPEDYLTHKPDT